VTQTLEEKRARRKARREKRKLAKAGGQVQVQPKVVPTKTPDPGKERSLYPVRVPHKSIAGITFVRFRGTDSAFPDCYRIYHGIHFLGIIHANSGTKKCRVSQPESLSKAKRDPRSGPRTFDNADEAIQFLIANYYRSL
jgi:hypothetical protein